MSTEKDAILEKIKKLRGGTPAEIETAMALAAELARKHGIDLGGVDPDREKAQNVSHIDTVTSARIGWECKYASLIVQEFFNVTALVRQLESPSMRSWGFRRSARYCITLIGTSWDTQIAIYVYNFLVRQFRHCWKHKRGRTRNRQAFMYGMYHGLSTKLDEKRREQVNEAGLVLVGKQVALRNDYMKNTFGKTEEKDTTPDGDASRAKLAGYMAGRATEIRSGLTDSGKSTLLLQ